MVAELFSVIAPVFLCAGTVVISTALSFLTLTLPLLLWFVMQSGSYLS